MRPIATAPWVGSPRATSSAAGPRPNGDSNAATLPVSAFLVHSGPVSSSREIDLAPLGTRPGRHPSVHSVRPPGGRAGRAGLGPLPGAACPTRRSLRRGRMRLRRLGARPAVRRARPAHERPLDHQEHPLDAPPVPLPFGRPGDDRRLARSCSPDRSAWRIWRRSSRSGSPGKGILKTKSIAGDHSPSSSSHRWPPFRACA